MKRREKRGLSPVIATVLLVGLVVVSGLIVFTWFRGFVQDAVTKFDENIQLVCNDVKFDARPSSGGVAISNRGNIPIFGFKVKIESSGGFETKDTTDEDFVSGWPDGGLNKGGAVSVNLAGTSGTDIVLTPILIGSSQGGAQASFACDENRHGIKVSL